MTDINRIRSNIANYYKQQKENKAREHSANSNYNKYYQSSKWKKLREWYKSIKPLCEVCERQNIVTPATECHHMHPFSNGITEEDKWNLLLNPYNLCNCCTHHHILFHKYMKSHHTDSCSIDNLLSYEEEINKYAN